MVSEIEAGNTLLKQRRFDEADRHFEAYAQKHPDDLEPLRGLIRVGRARGDMEDLSVRLDRFLRLRPDALEEKTNWLQILASRGEHVRAKSELPSLLDLASHQNFTRQTGRRLLQLILFSLIGSRRAEALIRLRDRVAEGICGQSNSRMNEWALDQSKQAVDQGRDDAVTTERKEYLWSMRALHSEIQLALGDYEDFATSVQSLDEITTDRKLHRDLNRIREKIVSENFPDFEREKIFGIGLSRTGTSSLNAALVHLGYHSIHWNNPMTMDLIDDKDFFLFDAFTDVSVSHRFEWLYYTFPNSKFILTTRDALSWDKSITSHYENHHGHGAPRRNSELGARQGFEFKSARLSMNLYGKFDKWVDARADYHRRVYDFFDSKPKERFLKLKIVEREGYDKLCAFLGRPVPDRPFPHANLSAVGSTALPART